MSTKTPRELIDECAEQLYADGHYALSLEIAALKAAQPAALPVLTREALLDIVNRQLVGLYYCGRVWNAWNVGTMTQDDFSPAEETEYAANIVDEIQAKLAQPEQTAKQDEIATVLEVLDKHAPFTTGSLLARVSQLCLITPAAQPVQPAAPYQVTDEQAEAVMTRLGLSDCRTAVKIALQHHEARKASA